MLDVNGEVQNRSHDLWHGSVEKQGEQGWCRRVVLTRILSCTSASHGDELGNEYAVIGPLSVNRLVRILDDGFLSQAFFPLPTSI